MMHKISWRSGGMDKRENTTNNFIMLNWKKKKYFKLSFLSLFLLRWTYIPIMECIHGDLSRYVRKLS